MHSFRRALTIAVASASLLAAAVPAAQASYAKTTYWYTIDMQSSSPSQAPGYLTVTSAGVSLSPYRSGDPSQMWTVTQPDYPAPARTESASRGVDSCGWGVCDPQGHAYRPVKLVNRASGQCLQFAPVAGRSRLAVKPCITQNDSALPVQLWESLSLTDSPVSALRPTYSSISTGVGDARRCITSVSRQAPSGAMEPARCTSVNGQLVAFQSLRFLQSKATSCSTRGQYDLCFVDGPRR